MGDVHAMAYEILLRMKQSRKNNGIQEKVECDISLTMAKVFGFLKKSCLLILSMKHFLFVLALPCVLGAEMICSDGKACRR
ncbi:hypothetical protein CEXT_769881 [Caerostris extrusa]|uniref:Uncharacterized protein n=1 Tax=Caerostris extrusa TaxID=172846 RepID=A0AAV4YES8_CAEEX|nr:hypothetical protein CEXT_769881 [Caerostris extrusa]